MKPLPLDYRGPKLRTSEMKALEDQLEHRLPEDYRAFLLRHNGGSPKRRFFKHKPSAEYPSYVDRFFFIDKHLAEPSPNAASGSLSATLYWHRKDNLPNDCLPIAQDEIADLILLGFRGRRRGKVLLKIIVEAADLIELEGPSVSTLAKSFSQFVDGLMANEEELK